MAVEISRTHSARALLTRNFIVVTLMLFCTGMVGEMLTPTLPQFALSLGVDMSAAGLAGTVFGISAMCFRPIAGTLTDRMGRRKTAMIGAALFILAFSLYLFVTQFYQVLLVRAIQGVASCTISTALSAIVTDVVPSESITEGVALANVSGAITMSISPAIGLWIVSMAGYHSLFMFGLFLLTVTVILLVTMNYREAPRQYTPVSRSAHLAVLEPSALLPMAMYLLLTISMSAVNVFLPQYASVMGGDSSVFFLIICVGVIYTRTHIGSILEHLHEKPVVLGGAALYFVCIGVFSLSISTPVLILSGLILGFGYGAALAVLNGIALRRCAPNRRGAAIATYSMGLDIGFAIGSLLWGIVIQHLGYEWTFLLAGLNALLVIPLYLAQEKHQSAE